MHHKHMYIVQLQNWWKGFVFTEIASLHGKIIRSNHSAIKATYKIYETKPNQVKNGQKAVQPKNISNTTFSLSK